MSEQVVVSNPNCEIPNVDEIPGIESSAYP